MGSSDLGQAILTFGRLIVTCIVQPKSCCRTCICLHPGSASSVSMWTMRFGSAMICALVFIHENSHGGRGTKRGKRGQKSVNETTTACTGCQSTQVCLHDVCSEKAGCGEYCVENGHCRDQGAWCEDGKCKVPHQQC